MSPWTAGKGALPGTALLVVPSVSQDPRTGAMEPGFPGKGHGGRDRGGIFLRAHSFSDSLVPGGGSRGRAQERRGAEDDRGWVRPRRLRGGRWWRRRRRRRRWGRVVGGGWPGGPPVRARPERRAPPEVSRWPRTRAPAPAERAAGARAGPPLGRTARSAPPCVPGPDARAL